MMTQRCNTTLVRGSNDLDDKKQSELKQLYDGTTADDVDQTKRYFREVVTEYYQQNIMTGFERRTFQLLYIQM